ncbi:sugar ABC transporter ATP-binding protein [Cohnella sp. REN36]|uniref:sugar ABC transporter ATP-binding protein n=1 Tax=Cohnella sp. REN36 TaxID=2887347 RepID=UPI001D14BA7B|nr:sugar ABC transporter ATP-binding protein [Cohnella sp. REN36]MCC3373231.1 sugar ABC transporter ATP-binding protein [Cohnella sp. REN36]
MPNALIELKGIAKSFAGVHALKDVSLRIDQGEIHCLAGENGCGKSTLIKVMSGVHAPDHGEIYLEGQLRTQLNPFEAIQAGIQVIYQDFSVFPNLSVAENIALSGELARRRKWIDWRRMRRTAKEALAKVGIELDLDAKVEELSVADKQLIAISRALMQRAKLIVMDEPTTALTQKEVRALFDVIEGLKRDGISILFVSHKLEEVFALSERITVMRNGRRVVTEEARNLNREMLVYHMTGRQIEETHYEAANKTGKPLLRTDRLGLAGCFEEISLELYPGEIVGLTGLLGSGRTELAESLFGLLPATAGRIEIGGESVRIRSVRDAVRHRIAYVPEDRLTEGLFLQQSIERNLIVSVVDRQKGRLGMVDRRTLKATVRSWIEKLGIKAPSPLAPVKTLSGGNQQRVVLARWLAANPKLLILNGPSVGVDIGSKEDIHQAIRQLAAQGIGVLMISDDLPELRQNCNRVLVMKRGRLIGEVEGQTFTPELWAQMHEENAGSETEGKRGDSA